MTQLYFTDPSPQLAKREGGLVAGSQWLQGWVGDKLYTFGLVYPRPASLAGPRWRATARGYEVPAYCEDFDDVETARAMLVAHVRLS